MKNIKQKTSSQNSPTNNGSACPEANEVQFELELCWCVQQLENYLNEGKISGKRAEDYAKNIKTLKSSSVPLIRKRQIMKAFLGDYRLKMRDEEKKLASSSKNIKFTPNVEISKKSSFVKKSAILTSGKDFRFNFTNKNESFLASDLEIEKDPDETAKVKCFSINKDVQTDSNEFRFNFVIDTMQ